MLIGAPRHTSLMQSRADAVEQTDSARRDYGGGCATRRGTGRGMKPNQGWASCAQIGKPITSSAAIVASYKGDGGQGRVGVGSIGASRVSGVVKPQRTIHRYA